MRTVFTGFDAFAVESDAAQRFYRRIYSITCPAHCTAKYCDEKTTIVFEEMVIKTPRQWGFLLFGGQDIVSIFYHEK